MKAELTRIEQGKQPYYIAVEAKSARNMIDFCFKAGTAISNITKDAAEENAANQQWEMNVNRDDRQATLRLREAQRGVQACITAVGFMQTIFGMVEARATQSMLKAQIMIVGADGNDHSASYVPNADHMQTSLNALRDLTMSYVHDLAEYGEVVTKHNGRIENDGFEIKTQKEALRIIHEFCCDMMEQAIALADAAAKSVDTIDSVGEANRKEEAENIAADGIAAASMAKFACDLLYEAIGHLGAISMVTRTHSKFAGTASDLYGDLSQLTSNDQKFRLN